VGLRDWFSGLVQSGQPEKRAVSDAELYTLLGGGSATYAGPVVSEESARRYSAVYACIQIIAESIASLPLVLLRHAGRNKTRATDHTVYPLLHSMANPELTAFEWRELMLTHALSWGNGWSEKDYNPNGQIVGLWPLRPDKVEHLRRAPGGGLEIVYILPNNERRIIPYWRLHHIKGPGDGMLGASPIRLVARQAAGLGLALEEFGARFFSNGARPGMILKHPGKLSPEAYGRLSASFANAHQGLSNAHRTKILEEGMDLTTIGIPPNEAQFIESRKFQVTEIARIFRVPPHMLADLDRATFSNIEHQSLSFVQHTLLPWLVRHEQAISRDLLTETERKTIEPKYIVAGMLRGDMASRSQAYNTGINAGYMTRNEVRELEDLNPLDGLDEPLIPLNMVEVGQTPPTPTAAPTVAQRAAWHNALETRADPSKKRRAMMTRQVRLFEDAAARMVKREVADIRKALPKLNKRSIATFETWLEEFYTGLRDWAPGLFEPILLAYAESMAASVADELDGDPVALDDTWRQWITEYIANFVSVYAVGGEKQLRALLADAEDAQAAGDAISERLTGWEETKAQKTALEQAFEAGNALAYFAYGAAGVATLIWRASGESCPLCQKMDGRKIKIGQAFLDAGDSVTADGVDPLPIIKTIRYGPLHGGCDCVTVAG
jgi:HK97 family phage portal protein